MTIQTAFTHMESLVPVAICISLGLLALVGIRELLKETTVAFKKRTVA